MSEVVVLLADEIAEQIVYQREQSTLRGTEKVLKWMTKTKKEPRIEINEKMECKKNRMLSYNYHNGNDGLWEKETKSGRIRARRSGTY